MGVDISSGTAVGALWDAESYLLSGALRFVRCFVCVLWWIASLAPEVVFVEQKYPRVENRTDQRMIASFVIIAVRVYCPLPYFLAPAI